MKPNFVIFAVLVASCGLCAFGAEPLEELRGKRAVVEFPDLDHFGDELSIPREWGYHQATGESLEPLQETLGVEAIPAVVCIDEYGNVLVRDQSPGCRKQIKSTLSRFEKRQRELRGKLARWWKDAQLARRDGKASRELDRLGSILEQGVVGYPEVLSAEERHGELDRERRRELLEILAGEGIESSAKIANRLKELARRCKGLPVERLVARERKRLEAGFEVDSD